MLLEGFSKAVHVTCQTQPLGHCEGQEVTILLLYLPRYIHFLSIPNIPPKSQPNCISILLLGDPNLPPVFQYYIYFHKTF